MNEKKRLMVIIWDEGKLAEKYILPYLIRYPFKFLTTTVWVKRA